MWITAVGIAAAIMTTSSFLPQVRKTLKSGRADDFSWGYLAMFSTGVTLWLIYGLLEKDIAIIGANGVTLVLVLILIAVKARSGRGRT